METKETKKTKGKVISLYDYTGEALRPWAASGYECKAYDIQHPTSGRIERFEGGGSIEYVYADLHSVSELNRLRDLEADSLFAYGWPVCTDLAVSGAAHFASKREKNPYFQMEAASHASNLAVVFKSIGCPYIIENPVSVLATIWRKPDFRFHPWQYGGYIPEGEENHPRWPEYIAPRDSYPKRTCLWTGGGFVMPQTKPVACPVGWSTQHSKLGGKSKKTKDIRSATPRGFAIAVFEANR